MIPVGYMYKSIASRPDWLKTDRVADIYSLSGCISSHFADYINYWKHNGYWLFNSPQAMEEIAREAGISLSDKTLFYYEVYDQQFDQQSNQWVDFWPEASFSTDVLLPQQKQHHGFDVVTFMNGTSPECSPLSCNHLASNVPVNSHCLFDSLEEATQSLESGAFNNTEPGPLRVFGVYTVEPSPSIHGVAKGRR
jgi:hypothetical protein